MNPENSMVAGRSGWSLALGTVLIVLGIAAMIVPLVATLIVIGLIGWLLIFAGIEQGIYAYRNRHEGGLVFRVILAALCFIIGILLLRRPVSGTITATAILGSWFLFDGIMEVVLGLQLRRQSRGSNWLFASGIMSVILGIIVWRQFPWSATWVIGVLVGIRLVFKGVEHIMGSSAGHRPAAGRGRNWPRRAA